MGISPTVAALIAASAATSAGGAILSSQAQSRAADAIRSQNLATEQAQQQAFNLRLNAANTQTDAQRAAAAETMTERNQAFSDMRQRQLTAQQQQQDVLSAENTQAQALRQQGDTQAQTLLEQTNAAKLAQAQDDARKQQAALLAPSLPGQAGPTPTDPNPDPETKRALATRMAQAASNVRDYGAKVADLQSYDQPTRNIALAIAANQFGIMPAQAAEALLKSGSATRLLPTQVAFRNAGDLGQAMDQIISSRGQSALDTASLAYGNATGIANLQQGDITQLAANRAAQAKADAAFQASIGNIISGVGQLGLYGAGYYGAKGGGSVPTVPGGGTGLA